MRSCPDFLLDKPGSYNGYYTFGALAGAISTSSTSSGDAMVQSGVAYYLVPSTCTPSSTVQSSFALFQRLPGPAGIFVATTAAVSSLTHTHTHSSAASTSLAVFGPLPDIFSDLQTGRLYYATTQGVVFSSGSYLGSSATGDSELGYVTYGNVLVAMEQAQLGWALDSNTLFLSLED